LRRKVWRRPRAGGDRRGRSASAGPGVTAEETAPPPARAPVEIHIAGLSKTYPNVQALAGVDLTIRGAECLVLLGPSGCGKTTLLRLIAGFEESDEGSITMGGRDVMTVPTRKRRIGMVFQSYALFPHLRVRENIAFGLRMARTPNAEVGRRVTEVAELLRIDRLLERLPGELSGGERQRVAVARAVVTKPSVILMDEPLSSLDAQFRDHMRGELKRLLSELHTTTVYVTHDQEEALSIGDRVAVMRDGRVLQCGTPWSVYDRPSDSFVAEFIGKPAMNVLRGVWQGPTVSVAGRSFPIDADANYERGTEVLVGVRAENVSVTSERQRDGLEATVQVIELSGPRHVVTLETPAGLRVKALVDIDLDLRLDSTVWFRPEPGSLRLLASADHDPGAQGEPAL
jgi:multiple sugar transport system ATP-binding protein